MRHILVPLDGSRLAETILPIVETLARASGTELTLVRAVSEDGLTALDPELVLDLTGEAEAYLLRVADWLASRGFAVRWEVSGGRADRVIAEAASRYRADLIAMATHGRSGVTRLLFGSVAERVVRHGPAPALLVRGEPPRPLEEAQRVLVPLDGSALAEAILPVAERLARPLGLRLVLLHAIEPPSRTAMGRVSGGAADVVRQGVGGAEEYLSAKAAELGDRGLRVQTLVEPGRPVDVIRHVVGEGHALVAMTTHGRRGLGRMLLGSTATTVLRTVEVPLVLWKPSVLA